MEKDNELGKELQIFGAEEKKDLFQDKILTRWIFRKLLDEERLTDLGTGKSRLVHKDMTVVDNKVICRCWKQFFYLIRRSTSSQCHFLRTGVI